MKTKSIPRFLPLSELETGECFSVGEIEDEEVIFMKVEPTFKSEFQKDNAVHVKTGKLRYFDPAISVCRIDGWFSFLDDIDFTNKQE